MDRTALDLTDDERAVLVRLIRRALDEARYPLSPQLDPLKAVLAKLEPPAPRPDPPPLLSPVMAPRGRRRRRG
jgi:hypothetical protein